MMKVYGTTFQLFMHEICKIWAVSKLVVNLNRQKFLSTVLDDVNLDHGS